MKRSLLLALGLAMAACSPTSAPPDTAAAKSAIAAANDRFIDAFKRGDKAAMVAAYTDDATVMMPNTLAQHGKAAIDQGLAEFLANMTYKDGGLQSEDLVLGGDLAVETGTYTWTLQTKDGGEFKDKGKYLTVWRRQPDGSWKILRDINNSDLPAK